MKSLKSKLIASTAMLLVAAIMLTSSSFAWYTMSKAGKIDNVEVNLNATKNLEIARATTLTATPNEVTTGDASTDTTWGSRAWNYATSSAVVSVPAQISTDGKVQTVTYGADNRVDQLVDCTEGTMTDGFATYTQGTNTAAVEYGAWLRANQDLNDVKCTITGVDSANVVVLVDGTKVTNGGTFSLTANEPKFVKVIAYIPGSVVAADVVNGINDTGINVDFTSASVQ